MKKEFCPSEYKRNLNGENYKKNGNCLQSTCYWIYSTVNAILTAKNEMYIRTMVQGKKHQRMEGRQMPVAEKKWIRGYEYP